MTTASDRPPTEARKRRKMVAAPSLVLVNTGHGKGKTTAAMGTLLRAVARGWKVCVVQFIKSGRWRAGEEKVARELGVDWRALGDGFSWESEDLGASEALARSAWEEARAKIASGNYDLVVLDEITYPVNWGWISLEDVAQSIRRRPEHVNIVVTGRDAPEGLVELADTVTEMVKIRHGFDKGIRARRGIDY
jgi:cob(I)alamin adenosyltransferase